MQLINHQFKSKKDLQEFINKNITEVMSLLIQVFCGNQNIQNVLDVLKQKLPKAQVIGSSTTGEIDAGEIYEKTIL